MAEANKIKLKELIINIKDAFARDELLKKAPKENPTFTGTAKFRNPEQAPYGLNIDNEKLRIGNPGGETTLDQSGLRRSTAGASGFKYEDSIELYNSGISTKIKYNKIESGGDVLTGDGVSLNDVNTSLVAQGYGENAGGKNIWNEKWLVGDFDANGNFIPNPDAYVCSAEKTEVSPSTTYYFLYKNITYVVCQYDENNSLIRMDAYDVDSFVTASNAKYIMFRMGTSYGKVYNHDICISTTKTEYVPYIMSNKQLTNANSNLLCLNVLGYEVPEEVASWYIKQNGRQATICGCRVDLSEIDWQNNGEAYYCVLDDISQKNVNTTDDNVYLYSGSYSHTTANYMPNESIATGKISSNTWGLYVNSSTTPKGYAYYELQNPYTITIDGNEAITNVNDSLDAQGLTLEKFEFEQGGYNVNTLEKYNISNIVRFKEFLPCNQGDIISFNFEKTYSQIIIIYDNTDHFDITNTSHGSFTVPAGKTQYVIEMVSPTDITPSSIGKCEVYKNNKIDKLKADFVIHHSDFLEFEQGITIGDYNCIRQFGDLIVAFFQVVGRVENWVIFAHIKTKYLPKHDIIANVGTNNGIVYVAENGSIQTNAGWTGLMNITLIYKVK